MSFEFEYFYGNETEQFSFYRIPKMLFNPDVILSIMQEQKADKIKITLGDDKLKKYFPKGYSKKQMEDTIIKLLEKWHRKLEMER